MRPSCVTLACVVVVLSLGYGSGHGSQQSLADAAAAAARQRAAQKGGLAVTREPEWIVRDIATAIEQMRARAAGERTDVAAVQVATIPGGPRARYDVAVAGRRSVLEIADHLWAAPPFTALARMERPEAVDACVGVAPSPLIASLLNPRADVLLKENARVSARLRADMSCADAHQEAALLAGAFALREAAGVFSDPRRLMSRMTAHLAMADANGGSQASDVRELADVVLLTLVGRQQTALDRIAAIEGATPAPQIRAWLHALRLRNTFDWRLLPEPPDATPLEKMALVRAFMMSTTGMQALDALDGETGLAEVPDWARLILQDNRPAIESGHRFSLFWIEAELMEAAAAFEALGGAPVQRLEGTPRDAIIAELNAEPADGPLMSDGTVQVLDWGTWAAAAQRHVLQAVVVRDTFLGGLCLPDEIKQERAEAAERFGRLRLFPLAAMIDSDTAEEFTAPATASTALVRSRPDLVTYWLWTCLLKKVPAGSIQPPPPDTAAWFAPYFLPGTAFDSERRPYGPTKQPRLTPADIDVLRKRAPRSRSLAYEASQTRGATLAAKQEMFGELANYDLGLIRDLAQAAWSDEKTYIDYMERAAQWDVTAYWDLAPYLADHGHTDRAIAAYQRWFDQGRDRVRVSTSVWWLVRQYFERGDLKRATAVAEDAAGVYSRGGLETLAALHLWRGNLAEAEALLRAASERYDYPHDLLAFLIRTGRTGREVDRLMAKVFPKGMARVATASLTGVPADGVIVRHAGFTGGHEGMKAGDVVVAVDGICVQNIGQYRVASLSSGDPVMQFIIWRGGRYIDVAVKLRYRWVVSTIDEYKSASPG